MDTNFDDIRKAALRLASLPDAPEVAKDVLVKMVADEASMIHFLNAITLLAMTSPAFNEVLTVAMRSMSEKFLAYALMQEIVDREKGGDD